MKIKFIKQDELFGRTFFPGEEIEVVEEIGKKKIADKTAMKVSKPKPKKND